MPLGFWSRILRDTCPVIIICSAFEAVFYDTLGQKSRHQLDRAIPQCDLPPTITSARVLAGQEQEEPGPSPGVGLVNLTRKDIV
jgi:hypothetical protein